MCTFLLQFPLYHLEELGIVVLDLIMASSPLMHLAIVKLCCLHQSEVPLKD